MSNSFRGQTQYTQSPMGYGGGGYGDPMSVDYGGYGAPMGRPRGGQMGQPRGGSMGGGYGQSYASPFDSPFGNPLASQFGGYGTTFGGMGMGGGGGGGGLLGLHRLVQGPQLGRAGVAALGQHLAHHRAHRAFKDAAQGPHEQGSGEQVQYS